MPLQKSKKLILAGDHLREFLITELEGSQPMVFWSFLYRASSHREGNKHEAQDQGIGFGT